MRPTAHSDSCLRHDNNKLEEEEEPAAEEEGGEGGEAQEIRPASGYSVALVAGQVGCKEEAA